MTGVSEARRLCVFAGSRSGCDPAFVAAARSLGGAVAARGLELVYGGGSTGLMGEVAAGCLDAGGTVIGVVPRELFHDDQLDPGLSRVITTAGMHERKLRMTELASAFAVLPGGYGTLDETFEAITWQQLGLHHKPLGFLDVSGFFTPLLAWLEQLSQLGFVGLTCPRPLCEADPEALLARLYGPNIPHSLSARTRGKAPLVP
ncbi:MAG: TIGR00730 family Rossman fold protein [Myxococcota bacterium]